MAFENRRLVLKNKSMGSEIMSVRVNGQSGWVGLEGGLNTGMNCLGVRG